jgi:hypothetical protein
VARPRAAKQAEPAPESEVAARVRDRIIEFKRLPASSLQDNERNWRLHPHAQRVALQESLEEVGIADALIAYKSARNGGKLTLIDGHLRREDNDDLDWPVLITDLDDQEADLLLATLDPLSAMAEADGMILSALLDDVHTGTPALEDLLRQLEPVDVIEELAAAAEEGGPAEMELQPMEHYDYVVFMFRNALDWQRVKERLELEHEGFTLRDGETRRVGFGRVLDGKRLLTLLDAQDDD